MVRVSGSGSGILALCEPGQAADVANAMAVAFAGARDGVTSFPLRPVFTGVAAGAAAQATHLVEA